jgi:hypothetical protein
MHTGGVFGRGGSHVLACSSLFIYLLLFVVGCLLGYEFSCAYRPFSVVCLLVGYSLDLSFTIIHPSAEGFEGK